MKLGQFLDKVDVMSDISEVDIWVQGKDYSTVCGVYQPVNTQYHVVSGARRCDPEVGEYLDHTLVSCYIDGRGEYIALEFIVKDKPQK